MGGNAMSFETRRVEREEYFRLVDEISNKLREIGVSKFSDIPAYRTKPNFGDIDILIVSDLPNRDKWIQSSFNPKEIHHNSNCFSFDYKDVQVDFIFTKDEEYQSSINYFSWNDLGNLLGRIYHKMGLKFGHHGLSYTIRDGDYQIGEILLTREIDEILALGDYNFADYRRGFDTVQEIYDYVRSSSYYSYEIFDLDNRNYRARTRDRKRSTYTGFLEYAKENLLPNEFIWDKDKSQYLPRILEIFGKTDEYNRIMESHEANKKVKQVFNGTVCGAITGLSGKELGAFMQKFKAIFYMDDLLIMTPRMIREEIENLERKLE